MLGYLYDRARSVAQQVLIEDCQLGNRGFIIMFAVGDEKTMTEQQITDDLESNCGGRYQCSEATHQGKRRVLYYGNDGRQPACVMRQGHVTRLHGVYVRFDPNQVPYSRF